VNITVKDLDLALDYHNFTIIVHKKPKIIEINNVPKLLNFKISPDNGDTETEFTFTVKYFDLDNEPPENIQVIIDGIVHDMILIPGESPFNGKYEFKKKLSEGEHSYYFTASDGIDINTSGTFNSPDIYPLKKISRTESNNSIITLTISFIIILIIITTLFIGGTEVGKYKFLTLFVVPLYNKLNHDKVFENYTRGKIHGYIQAKPGDHYNAIKYALKLKNGTLTHHTRVLEKEGLISIKRDGFYTRFYPIGAQIEQPKTPPLKQIREELIDIIRNQPGITQHEIIGLLELSQTVISYNLLQLRRNNILKVEQHGRENKYFINYQTSEPFQYQDQGLSSSQGQSEHIESGKDPEIYSTADSEFESKKI
jgi:predicted transcriptional regulator